MTQLLVAGGVSALAVGGFSPTLASAASSDSVTVAGGSSYTYTFNQSPSIQATAQPNCQTFSNPSPITLTLAGPGVTNSTLVSHKASCNSALTLSPSSSSVNTAHPAWNGGSTPADNGVYTVTLNNEGRTKSASFTLLIPPARPSGFAVTPQSPSTATFTWNANREPDMLGYQIADSTGNVIASPDYSACSGGTCSTGPVNLGSGVAGHTEHYSITALRSCGSASCSSGHVASTSAASASGTFPAEPPTPSPTPTKTSGGSSSGGGSNGSHSGGGSNGGNGGNGGVGTLHTSNGDRAGAGSGTVNLGNADPAGQVSHNLPPVAVGPLPAVNAPPLPAVGTQAGGEPLGAPPGKIKYPKPLIAGKNQSVTSSVEHAIKSGLKPGPLWRGIAAAAVLILIAVHLRAWVSRTEAF
ncbi:MAG: hypothetical protein ACTHK4_18120 [Mycobacteriales bacterium]